MPSHTVNQILDSLKDTGVARLNISNFTSAKLDRLLTQLRRFAVDSSDIILGNVDDIYELDNHVRVDDLTELKVIFFILASDLDSDSDCESESEPTESSPAPYKWNLKWKISHTLRKNVSAPANGTHKRRAKVFTGKVLDKDHTANYKTWGCKSFEHKNQRKWLQNRKKYESKVNRMKRKKEGDSLSL